MPRYLLILITVACVGLLAAPEKPTHTYQERAVAAVLMGEAWGQGKVGMIAVGEVIRERSVRLEKTPLQVVSVASKRGVHAFSCLNGTTMDAMIRKFSKKPEYRTALEVAVMVCRQPDRLPGVTRGATHFTRSDEKPSWAKDKQPVAVIGAHAFYKLRWI